MPLPLTLNVQSPSASLQDGSSPIMLAGRSGEGIVAELHGKFYTQAYRGNVFFGTAAVLTVPVVAASMGSVFSLYNPVGSGVNMEVIRVDVGIILATTVVDGVGWYVQAGIGSTTALPTAITVGTIQGGKVAPTGLVSAGKFLTAATHGGNLTLHNLIATFGATSTTADNGVFREYDGAFILPPGSIASLAMTTAAGTASGLCAGVSWAESPI